LKHLYYAQNPTMSVTACSRQLSGPMLGDTPKNRTEGWVVGQSYFHILEGPDYSSNVVLQ